MWGISSSAGYCSFSTIFFISLARFFLSHGLILHSRESNEFQVGIFVVEHWSIISFVPFKWVDTL